VHVGLKGQSVTTLKSWAKTLWDDNLKEKNNISNEDILRLKSQWELSVDIFNMPIACVLVKLLPFKIYVTQMSYFAHYPFCIDFLKFLTLSCPLDSGIFMPKQPDCTWLCASITLMLKEVESCSKAQKTVCLLVCTPKIFFWLEMQIFREWHTWNTFRPPWPTSPGPKPLDGSIVLKLLLETRLQPSLLILWMTCWVSGSKVMIWSNNNIWLIR